jgi:Xaa-Pro aminopeptidase
MDRFARGTSAVGYEERLDFATLRRDRVAKAQAERERAELDAILVWKDENVRYLTDLRPQLIAGYSWASRVCAASDRARSSRPSRT